MARKTLCIALLTFAFLSLLPADSSARTGKSKARPPSSRSVDMRLAFRDLWTDHSFWVRNVVMATKFGSEAAAKASEAQVMENTRKIADSFLPFYGRNGADRFFTLLTDQCSALKEYMAAAFTDSEDGRKAAIGSLEKTGEALSAFISSLNPYWSKAAITSALATHTAYHIIEIDRISGNDFSGEAETWKGMKDHTYILADLLAAGLAGRFPGRLPRP